MASIKKIRTCSNGHHYFKSSNCPVCPLCEKARAPEYEFMSKLSSPARRALENAGITTLKKMSGYSEKEILQLHGIGKASLPRLRLALNAVGLTFKNNI